MEDEKTALRHRKHERMAKIDRRTFLRLIGITAAGPGLIIAAPDKWSDFDPCESQGHGIAGSMAGPKRLQVVKDEIRVLLEKGMERKIPPQYRDRVTFTHKMFNWDLFYGESWEYTPEGSSKNRTEAQQTRENTPNQLNNRGVTDQRQYNTT